MYTKNVINDRGKSKDGLEHLREHLESIGVKLPERNRQAGNITMFTALVEGQQY